MATVIVNSSVWNRIHEYYDNVEIKYPNTWNINDTIAQISKIQWVISNFENVCFWSRESIILYWKHMGWKETWHKSSPWHFAFEYKRVNEQDYIFIQDAEHQDDIKESSFNLKSKIIENKLYNTMKNTRNKVRLTESQLHNVIKESVKQVLTELDWKTYANAANKMRRERGDADYWKEKGEKFPNNISKAANARQRAERLGQAAKDAFNRDFGYKNGHWLDDDYAEVGMGGDFGYTDEFAPHAAAWKHDGVALKKCFPHGVYTHERTPEEFFDGNPNSEKAVNAYNTAKTEMQNFKKDNYEYEPNGRGWYLKDNMDESIRRAIRKVLH